jgi:hypothetical protein
MPFRLHRTSRSPRERSIRSHNTTAASASATRAALGGQLVGAVALEVERVGDEGEAALDGVPGGERAGAPAAAEEDHHVTQAVLQEVVERVAQPGVVAEVADPGDDDAERPQAVECRGGAVGAAMSVAPAGFPGGRGSRAKFSRVGPPRPATATCFFARGAEGRRWWRPSTIR